jgi:hypothetical protein
VNHAPPNGGVDLAPFRAPGLPVDVPRRESALGRVVRAAWEPTRVVLRDGAEAQRAVPSLRAAFNARARRVTVGLGDRVVFHAVPIYAAGMLFAVAWVSAVSSTSARWILAGVVSMTLVLGALGAAVVGWVMLFEGLMGLARALGRSVYLALATAGTGAAVFVGAAVRELGREVARRAYDARVQRERTQVRVTVETDAEEAEGPHDTSARRDARSERRH